MTKTFKYLSCLLLGALAVGAWSCSADEYSMPQPNITPEELVEGVAFTVEHDATNPNIIHLTSLVPASYQVTWETPQGRKNGPTATLSMPFDGEYQVKMGIDTRGGYVWSEPYTFTIDDFCAEFVNHYMWTRLTGGVGKSKTWQLDLGLLDDGSFKTTFWNGPHYFFTNTFVWENLHTPAENETTYSNYMVNDPWVADEAIIPNSDWSWLADFPGNQWMVDGGAKNFGYMTLDLIGGANATITDADGNVVSKGTFMLDPDGFTLNFSDTYPLEATDARTHVRDFRLLYLSDDALQIMALPDGVSLNYVTKEYFENYVAPQPSEITLPDGWLNAFNVHNLYGSFKLDATAPFNWYDLVAQPKTEYKEGSYPAAFAPVESTVSDYKLKFDMPDKGKYTATLPDGSTVSDSYSISEKGELVLNGGLGDAPLGGSELTLSTNKAMALQVLDAELDDSGRLASIVLGRSNTDVTGTDYDYVGYKFVADLGGSGEEKTYKAYLTFSNTSDYNAVQGTTVFVKEGNFTVSTQAKWTAGDPLVWLSVRGILKDHPNADVKILGIRVDGENIAFDDAAISRGDDDDGKSTDSARRYICNAWGLASCFPSLDIFKLKNDIEVDIQIVYDNGTPFIPAN